MKMFNFAIENKETNNEKNIFYFRAGYDGNRARRRGRDGEETGANRGKPPR